MLFFLSFPIVYALRLCVLPLSLSSSLSFPVFFVIFARGRKEEERMTGAVLLGRSGERAKGTLCLFSCTHGKSPCLFPFPGHTQNTQNSIFLSRFNRNHHGRVFVDARRMESEGGEALALRKICHRNWARVPSRYVLSLSLFLPHSPPPPPQQEELFCKEIELLRLLPTSSTSLKHQTPFPDFNTLEKNRNRKKKLFFLMSP